eukprot:g22720.t1
MFHIPHEETDITRVHAGTHGNPSCLKKMKGVEREVVEGEDKLNQAEEGGGGWGWFRSLLQEETEGPKNLLVGNVRVKGLHIHCKEEVAGTGKLEVLKP